MGLAIVLLGLGLLGAVIVSIGLWVQLCREREELRAAIRIIDEMLDLPAAAGNHHGATHEGRDSVSSVSSCSKTNKTR